MKSILNKKQIITVIISLFFGLFIGFLLFNNSGKEVNHQDSQSIHQEATIWTCSMHPQIRQEQPGLCPICAMDLIPLKSQNQASGSSGPGEIQMSEAAKKLATIQTDVVRTGTPQKSLYLNGKVKPNEKNISELTARYSGRIEDLQVNFTGQEVTRGQVLGSIYSPELISAQQELLEAAKDKKSRPALYKAARSKLKLWDISDQQLDEIENRGESLQLFQILSPISGTVSKRHVANGDYVEAGTPLFTVIDLTSVWTMFEAYESDLPWIKIGDSILFEIQAYPGEKYAGKIVHIDPFINPETRIAQVRIAVDNKSKKLKPGMFARGLVKSSAGELAGETLIPKSAVLWTGKRSLVYTKVPDRDLPTYHQREVELGPRAGDFYVVKAGLRPGEEIVTNGVFKVDASAQLSGISSMMNPSGSPSGMPGGHRHEMSSVNGEDTQLNANFQTESFWVGGNCGMCKDRIEKAALGLAGVQTAEWGIETKQITVSYNPAEIELMDIHNSIAAVGHNTRLVKAPDDVYEKLPACCLYRKGK
jgi:Cu(I)/Ag(I) efflux system membrane fusion protein